MKLLTTLLCFLLCAPLLYGQEGFQFSTSKKKVVVPFQLVNNLIIIPIKVNGVELNFLLDTGVEETIIFSLDEKDELELYEIQKVKLKGLGDEAPTEGLKSSKNILTLPGLKSFNHEILIVLDEEFNFSSSLGIPVNGIIGSRFFMKNLIEINYSRKKIVVYNPKRLQPEKVFSGYKSFPITIENAKPYLQSLVVVDSLAVDAKCLIDTGNSDPVWLFKGKSEAIDVPEKNYEDFLGRGFNGDIHGKRAKIRQVSVNGFDFKNPVGSFPDSISLLNVKMVKDRLGSVGGELLKRFNIIFDYQNKMVYLKKNHHFDEPFRYNISGVSIHHTGLQWVSEYTPLRTELNINSSDESNYSRTTSELKYRFQLKPLFEISNIRKNSLAEKAGLQVGDVIVSINNKSAYKYSLQEMNALLKADAGEHLSIKVKRKDKEIDFRFRLLELL